jgi:hypothetical protein
VALAERKSKNEWKIYGFVDGERRVLLHITYFFFDDETRVSGNLV